MKTRRIASAILGLAFAGSALAAGSTGSASTSTTTSASLWQKLKESPATFSIYSGYDFNKNKQNQIETVTSTNIAYLGWKLTKKDYIRMENRWVSDNLWVKADRNESNKIDTTYSRQVLKYTRSGILKQDKHGMNLSANLEYRNYPDTALRAQANSNGGIRPSLSASKSFNNGFSLSGTYYHYRNLVKNKQKLSTYTSYNYLITTEAYSLTDKLSVSLTQEFYKSNKPGVDTDPSIKTGENLYMSAEIGYQINPVIYTALTAGNEIMKAQDGRLFKEEIFPNANWGAYVYISAF